MKINPINYTKRSFNKKTQNFKGLERTVNIEFRDNTTRADNFIRGSYDFIKHINYYPFRDETDQETAKYLKAESLTTKIKKSDYYGNDDDKTVTRYIHKYHIKERLPITKKEFDDYCYSKEKINLPYSQIVKETLKKFGLG